MSRMPRLRVQNPLCGACGVETRYDSDQFVCEDCLLSYGEGEENTLAEFLNEGDAACSKPCDNFWHGDHKINENAGYKCHPCGLPEGHTSMCWTNCLPINLEGAK